MWMLILALWGGDGARPVVHEVRGISTRDMCQNAGMRLSDSALHTVRWACVPEGAQPAPQASGAITIDPNSIKGRLSPVCDPRYGGAVPSWCGDKASMTLESR